VAAQLIPLVIMVLTWYNLVAASATGGVPFHNQQRSLAVVCYLGRQCHSGCERTCLRVKKSPPPPPPTILQEQRLSKKGHHAKKAKASTEGRSTSPQEGAHHGSGSSSATVRPTRNRVQCRVLKRQQCSLVKPQQRWGTKISSTANTLLPCTKWYQPQRADGMQTHHQQVCACNVR
jgi:hypothetical protein